MNDEFLGQAIGRIYDSAIDPTQWTETLDFIRDEMGFAFVSMQFVHFPDNYPEKPPETQMFRTEWDQSWIDALQPLIPGIPLIDQMFNADIDVPMSQLRLMDPSEFAASEFYSEWVAPQGLRDTLNTNIIKRRNMTAVFSAPTFAERDPLTDRDHDICRQLSPHLRRALLIGDLLDERNAQLQVLRATLDQLNVGVLLVEDDGRLVYANEAGETLLSFSTALTAISQKLVVKSELHRAGFMTAIARACSGSDLDLQNWGNGIALPQRDAAPVVAYVLPLGRSERRQALGPGMAAVFVTDTMDARPPSIELISAVTGLTTAEANIALRIAGGATPQDVSDVLGISIHTVRKHLSNAFDKTGFRSQAGLSAAIGQLSPPV